jgi:hypothetical protein
MKRPDILVLAGGAFACRRQRRDVHGLRTIWTNELLTKGVYKRLKCRGAGMSLLRRRAQPEVSDRVATSDSAYCGIEEAIVPLPRIGFEDWELRLALQIVELWARVRQGVGFGPIGQDFADAPASDRAAAHDVFARQGLLFLHSRELPAEFLVVKTDGALTDTVSYRSYCGHGDGLYRPLHACETLKEALVELWAIQQARAPLPKPALVE